MLNVILLISIYDTNFTSGSPTNKYKVYNFTCITGGTVSLYLFYYQLNHPSDTTIADIFL